MCVCVCVCVGVRLNIFIHSQMMLVVKNLPAKEKQIQSLGQEDPLEKKWQPTPVFSPVKFHGLYSPRSRRVGHT